MQAEAAPVYPRMNHQCADVPVNLTANDIRLFGNFEFRRAGNFEE